MSRLDRQYELLRQDVQSWAIANITHLKYRLATLGIRDHQDGLLQSVTAKLRKKKGKVYAVAISFERQGIFIEHGVGRGRKKGTPKAEAQKQSWLTNVLPEAIEQLADLMQNRYGNIVQEEVRLFIPGLEIKIT